MVGGVLSVNSQLDYEPHGDADSDNVYEVTVTASIPVTTCPAVRIVLKSLS